MKHLLLLCCAALIVGTPDRLAAEDGTGWRPLRREGPDTAGSGPDELAVVAKLGEALSVFERNEALNPSGRLVIQPVVGTRTPMPLPGGATGPIRAHLAISMWEPGRLLRPSVAAVRVNDPDHLLGEPLLTDSIGAVHLLPPSIPRKGGQEIRSRDAHPPGYEERYPSESFFPLWADDVAPFLRSLVRPSFGLADRSVTTVFTTGGRPFWKPVSQERWILALVARAQTELAEFQSGVEAADAHFTEQQISGMRRHIAQIRSLFDERAVIERHELSLQNARDLIAMAHALQPQTVEKVEAQMQATVFDGAEERLEKALAEAAGSRAELGVYEERLLQAILSREETWTEAYDAVASGDWDRLEALGRRLDVGSLVALADTGRALSALREELAGLSPTERRAPAWGFELPPWSPLGTQRHVVAMPFEPDRPSGLVSPGTPGARALVTVDPDLFASAAARSSVQLLTVTWHEGFDLLVVGPGGPGRGAEADGTRLLDALWETLDWQALRSLVDG